MFFYCLVFGKVSTILYNEQKLFSQGEETRCNCSKILPLRREDWTQMPAKFFLRTRRLDTNDNTIISPGREDSTQMVAKFFTRIWVSDSNGSKIHSWMRTGYKILSSRGDVAIQKTSKLFPLGRKAIRVAKFSLQEGRTRYIGRNRTVSSGRKVWLQILSTIFC